jgi:hypothetical protein
MDEATFKYIAADIIAKYYVELLQTNEVSKNRRYVLKKVNRALKSIDVDEVSYYFIRKFV